MSGSVVIPAVISIILGYFIGSVNTSIVVSKFYKIDIRQQGSGNAGLTNTMRVLGKKAAAIVLIGDVLKGIVSCLIGLLLAGGLGALAGGLGSIIGHNWPVYFKFRGGRGVLTSIAVVAFIDWRIMLILLGIFLIMLAITRYVSLGSITAAVFFPVISLLIGKGPEFLVFSVVTALMIIFRHTGNIKRLLNGKEARFNWNKSRSIN